MLVLHLVLLQIQNMMDIEEVSLLWFINVLIKNLQVVVFNLDQISNLEMNHINQLLKI